MTDGQERTWVDGDPEPETSSDAIVEDIEITRGAMTETVQAIGDRLSPHAIVADAKATVREATVGKVEDMAQSAGHALGEAGTTAQYAGNTIVETIKRNPVPAAMAALGIGWLATHTSSGNRASWGEGRQRWDDDWSGSRGTYTGRWDAESFQAGRSSGGPGQTLAAVGDTVSQKAGEVGDTVSQKAGEVGETLGQLPQDMRYRAEGLGEQASRFMEESPLVAGAVAVAVGAVIGSMIPTTEVEQRVLGPATEKVIDSAEQAATQAMADMEQGTTSSSSTSKSTVGSSIG